MGVNNISIVIDENIKAIDLNKNKSEDELIEKKPATSFLYFSAIIATMLMLSGGSTLVWQSPALIKLKSNDTQINPLGRPIRTIEVSMVVGIPSMISLIGGSVLPKLGDVIGRKKALQFFGLAMLLSLIGTAFSDTVCLLIIFLSVTANIHAGIWGLLPIYLTEISEDHNRGKFGCLMAMFLPLGQLYCYIIGSLFSIRDFTLLIAIFLIPFLMFFTFAPESPVYALSTGKKEDCLKILKKLRSNKTEKDLERELNKISDSLTKTNNKNVRLMTLFKTKEGRLGIFLAVLPMLVQFLSGVPVVMLLMAPIFNDTGFLSGNSVAIIVGAVKVFIYFISSLLIERTGRKPLLLISSIGAGIPISMLGGYFYLKHINSSYLDHLNFLPLILVIIYITLYSVGLGPIPVAVMCEMFPPDLRSVAIGCVTTICGSILSIVFFCFPLLVESIGTHSCMWFFGFSSFAGAVIIYFLMPETKGKSISEIQMILKNY